MISSSERRRTTNPEGGGLATGRVGDRRGANVLGDAIWRRTCHGGNLGYDELEGEFSDPPVSWQCGSCGPVAHLVGLLMTADQQVEPEWITAYTRAYEKVTGGQYSCSKWPLDPGQELIDPPLWGTLDPGVEADLQAWWHWIDTRSGEPGSLPRVPGIDLALDFDHAAAYALHIWNWIGRQEEDEVWMHGWVPLAGEQDGVAYMDSSHPDLPIYRYLTFGGDDNRPIAYGVRGYVEFYTALLDAGCFVFEDHPYRPVFLLTDAPLPPGIEPTHPLVETALRQGY